MFLLLCILVLIWSLSSLCADVDHGYEREFDYRTQERRHKELMELQKKKDKEVKHRRVRRVLKDPSGNIIGEEIIEEY